MPTLLRAQGYRFYFYSQDGTEAPHVHVDKDGKSAKYWMESLVVARNVHFTQIELREIARIISNHKLDFLRDWNDYFKDT